MADTWSRSAGHSLKIGDHRAAIKVLNGAVDTFAFGVIISVGSDPRGDISLGDTTNRLTVARHSVPIEDLARKNRGLPELVFFVSMMDAVFASAFVIAVSFFSYLFISRKTLKELERRMLEEQRIRETEVLGQVARQVAHDIRSPIGALGVLRHSMPNLDAEQAELLDSVIGRIHGIAQDILNKSRSHQPENCSVVDSRQILGRIVKQKQLEIGSRASIDWLPEPEAAPAFIRCDPIALQRIVSNLVNNSVEAMDHPGVIIIGLCPVPGWVILSVSDNGRGMSEAQLVTLGPSGVSFGKSESPTAGHGLGISYAFSQVEKWGGSVSVSSAPGQGTTVLIRLPVPD